MQRNVWPCSSTVSRRRCRAAGQRRTVREWLNCCSSATWSAEIYNLPQKISRVRHSRASCPPTASPCSRNGEKSRYRPRAEPERHSSDWHTNSCVDRGLSGADDSACTCPVYLSVTEAPTARAPARWREFKAPATAPGQDWFPSARIEALLPPARMSTLDLVVTVAPATHLLEQHALLIAQVAAHPCAHRQRWA